MLNENEVESCNRYLNVIGLVTNDWIEKNIRNEHLFNRLGKDYIDSVESFLNRKKSPNEIAVYTTYAYADFSIPRHYDILFDRDDVDNFVEAPFSLQYSIFNVASVLYLTQTIDHGHKHICILSFENEVPAILKQLIDIVSINKDYKTIGLCQKVDFEAIRQSLKVEVNRHNENEKKQL